jgi:hypothetical protein
MPATRSFEPLFSRKQEKTMKKLGRSFAAFLLLLAMTAVTLADGQMDLPLTTPTPQSSSTYTSQTDTPSSTTSTNDTSTQVDTTATEAGLVLFQAFSSVL